jgi:phage-related minor tail protein
MLDMTAVAADLQDQLSALQRAVEDQQATIDTLTDLVIDLLKATDARR